MTDKQLNKTPWSGTKMKKYGWQINIDRWNKSDYPDNDADTVVDMSAYD